ncbi:hypothetical protein G9A89_010630 [Geosiphon pyriformis]|nr:hypothetical protein G9A89_010630 [Geosiphon pyriformis]
MMNSQNLALVEKLLVSLAISIALGQKYLTTSRFNFNAPRVGNKEFSESVNRDIVHNRFTYENDVFHTFHWLQWGGYEIWIEPLDTCDCTEDQEKYWICADDENEECNAGQPLDKVPDQFFHNSPYFGVKISNCEGFFKKDQVFLHP